LASKTTKTSKTPVAATPAPMQVPSPDIAKPPAIIPQPGQTSMPTAPTVPPGPPTPEATSAPDAAKAQSDQVTAALNTSSPSMPAYAAPTSHVPGVLRGLTDALGFTSPRPAPGQIKPGEMIPENLAQPQPTAKDRVGSFLRLIGGVGNALAGAAGTPEQQQLAEQRSEFGPRMAAETELRKAQIEANETWRQGQLQNQERANENRRYATDVGLKKTEEQIGAQNLRAGYGPNGKPLPLESLSIPSQYKAQLLQIQQGLNKARLDALNADVATPAGRAAWGKLQDAHTNARAAMSRAGALSQIANVDMNKYLGDYFGVDAQGTSLPGVDPNDPMGMKMIQAYKPTGTQRTRSDLASMVQNSNAAMKAIVQKHPELFGPGAGQITSLEDFIGTLGPDAAAFETYLGSSAAANAGVHQFRSYNASQHFQKILSGGSAFGRNVNALLAGIDADSDAVEVMRKAGAMPGQGQGRGVVPDKRQKSSPASSGNSLIDDLVKKHGGGQGTNP